MSLTCMTAICKLCGLSLGYALATSHAVLKMVLRYHVSHLTGGWRPWVVEA